MEEHKRFSWVIWCLKQCEDERKRGGKDEEKKGTSMRKR
jgi:hypothetical protein